MHPLVHQSRLAVALLAGIACGGQRGGGVSQRVQSSPDATPRPAASPSTVQDGCSDDAAVDVLDHAIDLSLRLEPPSLSGKGVLRVRARKETASVTLDAYELRVSEVATASGPLPFRQAGDRVCAALPNPLAAGAELSLTLVWEAPATGKALHFAADQMWAGYRSSAWMPTLLDPGQRATLSLRITTTAGLKVAASGASAGGAPRGDGLTVHSFVLERPSPPFLYALAVGRFDEAELGVDGVTLRALGPAGSDLSGVLRVTAQMYRFFRDRTGAAFPAAAYVQVFVHGDAAQEAGGMALLSDEALEDLRKDPTDDWIFSHELAHQWFAWLVPCTDFADFWLNEGFATFLVATVKEERWGRAAYDREVGLWRTRSARVHAEGHDAPLSLSPPGAPPRSPRSDSELQPRGVTYARGALLLHRLRGELGDSVFWDGVRRYVKDRAGKGARSEDLRVALEAVSGRDLEDFFARWVYAPAPDL